MVLVVVVKRDWFLCWRLNKVSRFCLLMLLICFLRTQANQKNEQQLSFTQQDQLSLPLYLLMKQVTTNLFEMRHIYSQVYHYDSTLAKIIEQITFQSVLNTYMHMPHLLPSIIEEYPEPRQKKNYSLRKSLTLLFLPKLFLRKKMHRREFITPLVLALLIAFYNTRGVWWWSTTTFYHRGGNESPLTDNTVTLV